MIQRKFKLDRLMIVIVVTPFHLHYTDQVQRLSKKNMQIFQNFHPNPFFSSSNPLLNKFRICTCSICWSCHPKYSSNMACTYFRVLFLACGGRRQGNPNEWPLWKSSLQSDIIRVFNICCIISKWPMSMLVLQYNIKWHLSMLVIQYAIKIVLLIL